MMEDSPEMEGLVHDVEEMEALVSAFLDYVRGEAEEMAQPCDPLALARRVVENARRGGGQIELVAPDLGAQVPMRAMAVQRALMNVLANAMRYGTRARVSVALIERAVRFTVEADGPGIPADRRADAVLPFMRLDDARNQNKGSGVGLGLAIADDIARRHGGTLDLGQSAAMGGLRVNLTLPR